MRNFARLLAIGTVACVGMLAQIDSASAQSYSHVDRNGATSINLGGVLNGLFAPRRPYGYGQPVYGQPVYGRPVVVASPPYAVAVPAVPPVVYSAPPAYGHGVVNSGGHRTSSSSSRTTTRIVETHERIIVYRGTIPVQTTPAPSGLVIGQVYTAIVTTK